MNRALLDQIMESPNLPTLPTVAMKVIELCRDDTAGVRELGKVLSHDPALAAGVLRTVNSSYYGLRHRISSVQRAVIMLGIHSVKTLALGFSVLKTLRGSDGGAFDPSPVWSRSLLAAVGAQSVSRMTGSGLPDDAFISALLQDLGIIALLQTRPDHYVPMLEQAVTDHPRLLELENDAFGFTHPIVGAALAERWRFPSHLTSVIAAHETPDDAPAALRPAARDVALGALAANALLSPDPAQALADLDARAAEWFGIDSAGVDALLDITAEGGAELAKLFDIPTLTKKQLTTTRHHLTTLRPPPPTSTTTAA